MLGLTSYLTYKDITWGKYENRKLEHYVFYPLYDWSYTDIWKAIFDHGWSYCRLYDYMYQYGVAPMRDAGLECPS
jgi:predicted phosphoadenosine phosphosulfate sulfurtransferase